MSGNKIQLNSTHGYMGMSVRSLFGNISEFWFSYKFFDHSLLVGVHLCDVYLQVQVVTNLVTETHYC